MGIYRFLFVLLFASFWHYPLMAQLSGNQKEGIQVIPIGHELLPSENSEQKNFRTENNGDTLHLPFWDDFSIKKDLSDMAATNQVKPDTVLWQHSQNVSINNGRGQNPPTLGVATFDGVDAQGRPYSNPNDDQGYTAMGKADSLVSSHINLSTVPEKKEETVYLSFFWELEGNGEIPDSNDSLRLQFKSADGTWHTQWSKSGGNVEDNKFQQVILPVSNQEFFHNAFQFKFENFSRLSGPFDNWHIDYVFLNSDRSPSNTAYFDRALTSPPSSIFKDYTAIPMEQFKASPEKFVGSASANFYNLDALLQPIEYSAIIKNKESGNNIQVLDRDQVVNPVPQGFERRTFTASSLDQENIDTSKDSLYLLTEFFIKSGDTYLIDSINTQTNDTVYFKNVDYRVNDTARATYVLHDYFAYDDGSAEFGAGVNQNRGKIAYQYVLEKTDVLTHIDLHFPKIGKSQSGAPFTLYVWKNLENDQVMTRQIATVQPTNSLDEFVSYELNNPVAIADTFYIGIEQQTDDFLSVGLDKNTGSGEKIYFNVTGAWEKNTKISGSLMMRPGFGEKDVISSTNGPQNEKPKLIVYPNPGKGIFKIKGAFKKLEIANLLGQKIRGIQQSSRHSTSEVDLRDLPQGVYMFHFQTAEGTITKKVVLKK